MGIADSLKSLLKLVCGYCGGSEVNFRCATCGKKFCRTCVEFANKAVRKDLESVKTASVLQNNQSVTTFVVKLLNTISGQAREGYCPMCSIIWINQLVRGKQLSKLSELGPPCQMLSK